MSDRDDLRARLVAALGNASKTHPCTCGATIWSTCYHQGALSNDERRADAILAALGDDQNEQLEQARAALAAHVQTEDDIRTLLAEKDLPTGPDGAIAWDLGMAVLAHLDFPEPETPADERLAGLRALTEQLRKRNEQQAEQLEQARRWAVHLENENTRLTDQLADAKENDQ
ncbi:hypothetical protein ACFWMG_15520 [Streptomyces sp. NPDC127074]|uniref:hypothetical protein n=1 Tax=Streptomyces sp. NPDC127074 TaxID=3347130 RepID=UPI00364C4320